MRTAALWSGGIGDFLHYLTRIDAVLERTPEPPTIWIESSRPEAMRRLFEATLADVDVRFVPGPLHWTRSVPLLSHDDLAGRADRPAHRYVAERGYRIATDWFLPLDCRDLERSVHRLTTLACCTERRPAAVLSLRDKGALWWPTAELVEVVGRRLDGLALGSPDEVARHQAIAPCEAATDVAEALAIALGARWYVGTDTGLATVRELLRRPNIYCVDDGWRDRWMSPFGYWPVFETSQSTFVASARELFDALDHLDDDSPASLLFVYGTLRMGQPNHGRIGTARYLGRRRTRPGFELFDLGEYPAMVASAGGSVAGELYQVSEALLAELDVFEDHPHFFRRGAIELHDGTRAQAYLVPAERLAERRRIDGGDWWSREPSAGKLASDLPDLHHDTLLASLGDGSQAPTAGPCADLPSYLARARQLLTSDALFEKVEIELSLGCNRRCSYCNLASDRRENYARSQAPTMDWELYRLLVGQLAELEFAGAICFHYFNEPLLNKRLAEYVRHASDALPRTHRLIYTNGDLLTPELHASLTAAGVSLFVVTRHDDALPPALAEVAREPNVVVDMRAHMTLNNRGGDLGPPRDPRVASLPCIYTAEALVVTIDGNVLPCSCDFRERLPLGNIRERPIGAIFRSDRCAEFRRDLLNGHRERHELCRACDFYCEVLGVPSGAEALRFGSPPLVTLRAPARAREEV